MPETAKAQATLGPEDLEKLPSNMEFYDKFNKELGNSRGCNWLAGIDSALARYDKVKGHVGKIASGFCYVSNMEMNEQSLYQDRCNFLNYWIMSLLPKDLDSTTIEEIINAIDGELQKLKTEKDCELVESSMDINIISKRKTIFDYWHDHKKIQALLESRGPTCGLTCGNYLRDLISTYESVSADCNGVSQHDEYCKEFKEKFNNGEKKIPQPSELKCTSAQASETEAIIRAKEAVKKKCQGKLPSGQIYCELNETNDECSDSSAGTIKHKLKADNDTKQYADQIVQGWCHAPKMEESILPGSERCKFLYYWLGDTLLSGLNDDSKFSDVMKVTYGNLKDLGINEECTNIYESMSKEIFEEMKNVYNYSRDHKTIKECIEGPDAPKSKCTGGDVNYLDKVLSAYKDMDRHCKDDTTDIKYCGEYRKMVATHTLQNLLKLKCSLKYTSDCTNIPAAILGTLGTISLPAAVAFFLHKTILPYITNDHHHALEEEQKIADNLNNKGRREIYIINLYLKIEWKN
ncbi:KIR protein [Plasmodium coatneyi]|uniref:KIR protein n=1 Tax=Plasmodium coatneyi TaxID=208452 RepID=A0A1B1E5E5_9APIC|nr:KIR protein [Plasmodium coatneyi]ANQ10243.1 KIR protein [Plasmodium coatneyi]